MKMKKQIVLLAMSAAMLSAQAVVIDFTDNSAYPVGNRLHDHSDWWSHGAGAAESVTNTASGALVSGNADAAWDSYRYLGEVYTPDIGDTITSSIDFTFNLTGGNGWAEVINTGIRSSANDNLIANFSRAGNGNGPTSEFSLEFGGGETIFYGSDLGFTGLNQASALLTLTYAMTKTADDTWDGTATIFSAATLFTTNRTVTGINFADTASNYGVWGTGREDGAIGLNSRTVSEFTVIPEPATLGLVVAVGTGVLFIRRRFML